MPSLSGNETVEISAHLRFVLFINGERVTSAITRAFPENTVYYRIEVAKYLNVGENDITVVVIPHDGLMSCGVKHIPGLFVNSNFGLKTDCKWTYSYGDFYGYSSLKVCEVLGSQEHFSQEKSREKRESFNAVELTDGEFSIPTLCTTKNTEENEFSQVLVAKCHDNGEIWEIRDNISKK